MTRKPANIPVKTAKKEKPRLSPLEKAQARFNKLISDIENAEAANKQQAAQADRYHQLYQQKLLPLLRQYAAEKLLLVHQFDAILADSKFSKTQRRRYIQWSVETLMEIAAHNEEAATLLEQRREELIALLPKNQRAEVEKIKARQAEENEAGAGGQEDEDAFEWEQDLFEDFDYTQYQQQHRPRKQEEAAPEVDDIGPLYKELAKKLHPDLEQDEAAKAHKHELMQQLTQARKNRDLFTMLRIRAGLQEATSASSWPLDQLKRFNKMLEAKLKQLNTHFSMTLMGSMINQGFAPMGGRDAEKEIEKEIRDLKKTVRSIREDRAQINSREHLEALLEALRWEDGY